MSYILRIAIGLLAAAFAVAAVTYVVYSITKTTATGTTPRPPVPPIPGEETTNIYFYNGLSTNIIVIPIIGTATDSRGWTSWPPVFDQADPTDVVVPHAAGLTYKTVAPTETISYNVLTAGSASLGFIVRVNCDSTYQICEMGDSVYVQNLDGPTRNDLYRDKYPGLGQVPFKPAIDTRVELTWGCAYKDLTLCGVNPSCITNPAAPGCAGLTQLMDDNPTAKFSTNGLLYKPNGSGGQTNIPLVPTTPGLSPPSYFDISCVDGYTVPMILQVKRPGDGSGSECTLRTGGTPLDNPGTGWSTVANTSHLVDLTQCPSDELLWPASRVVASVPVPPGDGYNTHGGVTQFDMPWVTQATPGAPVGTKLLSTFTTSSATDLKQYRNPKEVTALGTTMGWTINNIIGCSSPCSFLTMNSAVSQMYPKTGGKAQPDAYTTGGTEPFISSDRGVTEVCCKPTPGSVVTDSNLQCNTSKWWTQPPGSGPAAPSVAVVQYNFGFYVNDFAPSEGADQPWWDSGTQSSINPYRTGPQDKYVAKIRDGQSGQAQTTRAYAYAHDDAWNTIVCGTLGTQNESTDSRGVYYNRYDVRVIIGTSVPP